jgi:hypothetical protein
MWTTLWQTCLKVLLLQSTIPRIKMAETSIFLSSGSFVSHSRILEEVGYGCKSGSSGESS